MAIRLVVAEIVWVAKALDRPSASKEHVSICTLCVPFKVEWLQQQVVQRRAKRKPRASHIYSTDTETKQYPSAHPESSHARTAHYNDSMWNSLWYTVSHIFIFIFLLY